LKYKDSGQFRGKNLEDTWLIKKAVIDPEELSLQGEPKQRGNNKP